MDGDAHGHGGAIGPAQFFQQDDVVPVIDPAAAVFFGVVEAQQSEIAHLPEHVAGRPQPRRFPLLNVGVDLRGDKPAYRLPEGLLFGGEVGEHILFLYQTL